MRITILRQIRQDWGPGMGTPVVGISLTARRCLKAIAIMGRRPGYCRQLKKPNLRET
ncbi:hypothetical protein GCM10009412_39690 [Aeromonas salmonicida subsp. achromogenes]